MAKVKYAGVWFIGDKSKKIHSVKISNIKNVDVDNINLSKPYYVIHNSEKRAAQIVVTAASAKEINNYIDSNTVGSKRIKFTTMRRSTAEAKLQDEEKLAKKEAVKQKRLLKENMAKNDSELDAKIMSQRLEEHGDEIVPVDKSSPQLRPRKVKASPLPKKEFDKKKQVLLDDELQIPGKTNKDFSEKIKTTALIHAQENQIDHGIVNNEMKVDSFNAFKDDIHEKFSQMESKMEQLLSENIMLKKQLIEKNDPGSKEAVIPVTIKTVNGKTLQIKTEPEMKTEKLTPREVHYNPSEDVIDLTDTPSPPPQRTQSLSPSYLDRYFPPALSLSQGASSTGDDCEKNFEESDSEADFLRRSTKKTPSSNLSSSSSSTSPEVQQSPRSNTQGKSPSIHRTPKTPMPVPSISGSTGGTSGRRMNAGKKFSKARKTLDFGKARKRVLSTSHSSRHSEEPGVSPLEKCDNQNHVEKIAKKRKVITEDVELSSLQIEKMRSIEAVHFKKESPRKHKQTKLVTNGLFPSRGKCSKDEDSEADYDSDQYESYDEDDFTQFNATNKDTKKTVKLFHLKHGKFIRFSDWIRISNAKTPSIFIRELSLLLFKKKKILMTYAVKIKKAGNRIPGHERKKLPVLEKVVLWKSYFYFLRVTYLEHKVEKYERQWKRFLSTFINQLNNEALIKLKRKAEEDAASREEQNDD